jgi:hypothetical protein
MANTFLIGNMIDLTAVFLYKGIPTDPDTIVLKVKDPSDNISTFTYLGGGLIKISTGLYFKSFLPDKVGTWYYLFAGEGAVTAAIDNSFIVRDSLV